MRAHSGKVVSAIALLVIAGVLVGFWRAGAFSDLKLPEAVAPYKGVNKEIPFASTPAEQWPDGDKGIVFPDQNPEYLPLYEAARKSLIAGHLDAKMLYEHKQDDFLAPLAQPHKDSYGAAPGNIATTRLDDGTKLLPNGIKADGRMWPGRDEHGRPVVHTSYRFAYAFDPGEQTLLQQYEIVAMIRADVDFQLTEEGLWLTKTSGYFYSMSCEASKRGFLAPAFVEKLKADPSATDTKSPEERFAATATIEPDMKCD